MKKYFTFFASFLLVGALWFAACGDNSKPDPCETDPQPGCPNYVDPCETDPQPGCPNYVDPCEIDPQPDCPNYVDPCETDPGPDCPNYDEPPNLRSSITIGSTTYLVDEKRVEKIDNGLYYMYAQIKNTAKPLIIHSVRFTTSSTAYAIETWVGNDCVTGKETPAQMVNRYEQEGREVKVAINAGFFGMSATGTPIGWQVSRGFLSFFPSVGENAKFPAMGFDENNIPYMGVINSTSKVKKESDNSELAITHVNGGRWENYMMLYNSFKGNSTGTNEYGTEVLCTPTADNWEQLSSYVNVRCKVDMVSSDGNMEIPKGKIVLSGHGAANNYLKPLKEGDYVNVTADFVMEKYPEITSATLRNAVSGYPYIILTGNTVVPPPGVDRDIETPNHPRTSVGYSTDKKYVYFTVVEGRNPTQASPTISAGVSTRELAQIMQYFGAANAINCDGGGSSCIMIGKETKNFVSDGNQRPVADGLAIIKK